MTTMTYELGFHNAMLEPTDKEREDLTAAYTKAYEMAEGESNDAEIDALKELVDELLSFASISISEPPAIPDGKDLVRAMKDAIAAVAAFKAPKMLLTKKGHLVCPHCGTRDSVQERDYDMRINEGEYEPDGFELTISQGDDEYETLCYECSACTGLVSLPEPVTTDWL
jgi:hypothetical protein